MICSSHQLPGFYMMVTLAFNKLKFENDKITVILDALLEGNLIDVIYPINNYIPYFRSFYHTEDEKESQKYQITK